MKTITIKAKLLTILEIKESFKKKDGFSYQNKNRKKKVKLVLLNLIKKIKNVPLLYSYLLIVLKIPNTMIVTLNFVQKKRMTTIVETESVGISSQLME